LAVTQVMGVLNVTPDSFSDGGAWFDHDSAIAHGLDMMAAGADVIDVGGESTRPGAAPVRAVEERRRVVPVIEVLARHGRVSVDTRKAAVAEAAVAAGATLVNDVSATLMHVAAAGGVGWVAMHMRGDPRTMQQLAVYDDVVAEVTGVLVERASRARDAGVEEVWIDPGIGFAKTAEHNLELLGRLDRLVATGWPVVIGTSRKSFLGALASPPGAPPAPVDDRLEGSLASAVWAAVQGARMVRVHDVAPTVAALRIIEEPVTA
jgi:dihydropteroate synthase